MNIATWILSALVGLVFTAAGTTKLRTPLPELLKEDRWQWATGFTQTQIRTIAALELIGAVGLFVPWITGTAKVLTPLAATGLALTMLGAISVHGRRHEWSSVLTNTALLAASAFIAVVRFTQL